LYKEAKTKKVKKKEEDIMAKKKKEEERPDETVLPDEFSITLPVSEKEIVLKPWSWGKWNKVAPHIDEILSIVESSSIDVSPIAEMFRLQDKVQVKIINSVELSDEEKEEYNEISRAASMPLSKLMIKVGHLVSPILELSSELEADEIEDLHPADVFHLAVSIYFINPTVLGNVSKPFNETE
jgi:hypothetical protein